MLALQRRSGAPCGAGPDIKTDGAEWGTRRLRVGRAFLAIVGAMALASAAGAETLDPAKQIRMEVEGRIGQRCSLGDIGSVDFGDLERSNLAVQAKVALVCNIPFEISIQSANGGLANSEFPGGQGPYAGLVGYNMSVAVPVVRQEAGMVSQTFSSTELRGGRSLSSAGGVAFDGMTLDIALLPPSGEAGLLAGNYSETITVTVAPT